MNTDEFMIRMKTMVIRILNYHRKNFIMIFEKADAPELFIFTAKQF